MRKDEYDCEIDMNALQSFKTGRVDCQPDANADRPFYTSRPEIHPNANANGEATVNYYRVSLYRPVESICLFWIVRIGLKLCDWIHFRAYKGKFKYLASNLTKV